VLCEISHNHSLQEDGEGADGLRTSAGVAQVVECLPRPQVQIPVPPDKKGHHQNSVTL
jgi:hypothetical protein